MLVGTREHVVESCLRQLERARPRPCCQARLHRATRRIARHGILSLSRTSAHEAKALPEGRVAWSNCARCCSRVQTACGFPLIQRLQSLHKADTSSFGPLRCHHSVGVIGTLGFQTSVQPEDGLHQAPACCIGCGPFSEFWLHTAAPLMLCIADAMLKGHTHIECARQRAFSAMQARRQSQDHCRQMSRASLAGGAASFPGQCAVKIGSPKWQRLSNKRKWRVVCSLVREVRHHIVDVCTARLLHASHKHAGTMHRNALGTTRCAQQRRTIVLVSLSRDTAMMHRPQARGVVVGTLNLLRERHPCRQYAHSSPRSSCTTCPTSQGLQQTSRP